MALTWLATVDGVLGFWILALGVYLFVRGPRTPATAFFGAVCLVAGFRVLYFASNTVLGTVPSSAMASFYAGSEDLFGVALVGTGLSVGRDALSRSSRTGLTLVYVAALVAILLLVTPDRSSGVAAYVGVTFLAMAFTTALWAAVTAWHEAAEAERRRLVFVVGPLFAWNLNDAIRIGMGALPVADAGARRALGVYTLVVACIWLTALLGVVASIAAQHLLRARTQGVAARALLSVFLLAVPLTVLQLASTLPNDMRAIHIAVDSTAITFIGIALARWSRNPADEPVPAAPATTA